MRIRWTTTALRDLEALHDFVFEDNPRAAEREVEKIRSATEALTLHPELGRKGRVAGTRELIVPPYVVAYRVQRGHVELLAIIHTARRWPELL
ncbi:MAG: type II toxin-antitoxin system RelE/ParE family toxin [Acidobacteriales bacterium]|nr:type II toxin-antitoxin system RelE/ParE family toxin [Terriglobales bacterium]